MEQVSAAKKATPAAPEAKFKMLLDRLIHPRYQDPKGQNQETKAVIVKLICALLKEHPSLASYSDGSSFTRQRGLLDFLLVANIPLESLKEIQEIHPDFESDLKKDFRYYFRWVCQKSSPECIEFVAGFMPENCYDIDGMKSNREEHSPLDACLFWPGRNHNYAIPTSTMKFLFDLVPVTIKKSTFYRVLAGGDCPLDLLERLVEAYPDYSDQMDIGSEEDPYRPILSAEQARIVGKLFQNTSAKALFVHCFFKDANALLALLEASKGASFQYIKISILPKLGGGHGHNQYEFTNALQEFAATTTVSGVSLCHPEGNVFCHLEEWVKPIALGLTQREDATMPRFTWSFGAEYYLFYGPQEWNGKKWIELNFQFDSHGYRSEFYSYDKQLDYFKGDFENTTQNRRLAILDCISWLPEGCRVCVGEEYLDFIEGKELGEARAELENYLTANEREEPKTKRSKKKHSIWLGAPHSL